LRKRKRGKQRRDVRAEERGPKYIFIFNLQSHKTNNWKQQDPNYKLPKNVILKMCTSIK
jgi:hypothetical protein